MPSHEFGNRTNLTAFGAAFVRVFSRLFSPKLFAVAFVLCGALSAQSAFAFGALAIGGSGSAPRHGVALNQATQAIANAEALRLCGADCYVARQFIRRCVGLARDSAVSTNLNFAPGTILNAGQARTSGFYSETFANTQPSAEAGTRAQALGNCNNQGGASCTGIPEVTGCDTTAVPTCTTSGHGVDPATNLCGVCGAFFDGRGIAVGPNSFCRYPTNQADCDAIGTGLTYSSGSCNTATAANCPAPLVHTGTRCRALLPADCTGNTPVLDAVSKTCRARQASDCTGATPVLDSTSGNCRAQQSGDCSGATPDFVNGSCVAACAAPTPQRDATTGNCRARVPSDCTGGTPILDSTSGNCRGAQQSDCTGTTPIFENNACRAATQADCTGTTPILDNGACRAAVQADCTGTATPILDNGACRAATQADCTGNTPILAGGACRAATQADCTGTTPILDNGACRAATQADCTGTTPILDNGACRAAVQADCTGTATPILESGACRAATQADCTGNTPILAGGACRAAANQQECNNKNEGLVFVSGGTCRDRVAGDCTGNTPIFVSASKTCRAAVQADCTGTATPILESGACRAATQADCTGTTTPILDSGNCRARQQSDCTGNTPILDGGNCRARQPGDCPEATPILDGSSCRARQASDCTGNTPILDSGACRAAANQQECHAKNEGLVFNGGACRDRVAGDCTGNTPIFVSASKTCRAAQQSDCTGNTPILDSGACRAAANQQECHAKNEGLVFNGGACRDRVAGDCTGNTPIFVSASKTCRAAQQSDCTGNTPILDSGNCRAATQADCTGTTTPILDSGSCRARQASDCTGGTPVLDATSRECRVRQQSDCTGNTPILDSGNCRARQPGDCPDATPILDGGSCRARQQSDCTGNTPILDGGNCRVRQAGDCTGNTPVFESGNCRARQQGDCTGNTPILAGNNCRARQASDCTGNTPILDGGNCRARELRDVAATTGYAAADCRNAGWTPIITSDRERCPIRNGEMAATSGGGESPAALAIPLNHGETTHEACVLRELTQSAEPQCADLFGGNLNRIPTMEELTAKGFRPAADHLVFHSDGRITFLNSATSANVAVLTPTTGGGGKAKGSFPEAIGGFVAVAGIAWAFSIYDGTPFFGAVQWSPHYSFAMSDGVRRYEVGSRWEWKRDNFSAHWTATKTSADVFAYGNGAKWTGEIFTAAFNSRGIKRESQLDFSLSAEKEFGLWSFSPQYRVDFDSDETDKIWRHALSLRAVWTADKWTLSNSAGFHGESLAAFGDNASAKVLLRREF